MKALLIAIRPLDFDKSCLELEGFTIEDMGQATRVDGFFLLHNGETYKMEKPTLELKEEKWFISMTPRTLSAIDYKANMNTGWSRSDMNTGDCVGWAFIDYETKPLSAAQMLRTCRLEIDDIDQRIVGLPDNWLDAGYSGHELPFILAMERWLNENSSVIERASYAWPHFLLAMRERARAVAHIHVAKMELGSPAYARDREATTILRAKTSQFPHLFAGAILFIREYQQGLNK